MLVLKRQAGEKLVIGNEITLEVLSVSGDGVRLGIVAPRETSVHRFEIFQEIQAVNHDASRTAAAAKPATLTNLIKYLRPDEEESAPLATANAG